MALRVLLVEADDSTGQIIAALLRRCSFRGQQRFFRREGFRVSQQRKASRNSSWKRKPFPPTLAAAATANTNALAGLMENANHSSSVQSAAIAASASSLSVPQNQGKINVLLRLAFWQLGT
ncbi:hypothetical protein PTKIN_Ptkin01aG0137400 [Pterospermum kingtungense]